MLNSKITHILFDLGNILVALRPIENGEVMCPALLPSDQMARKIVKDYECGRIPTAEFVSTAPKALGLNLSSEEFQQQFQSIVGEWYPEIPTLLNALSKQYHLGCLSNTNPLHIDALRARGPYLDLIPDHFFSHDIGCMKPDTSAYEAVLEKWQVQPENVFFIDDRIENVVAAREMGFVAEQAFGEAAVQKLCSPLLEEQ